MTPTLFAPRATRGNSPVQRIACGVGLAVWGLVLWTVGTFANAVPEWDEWDVQVDLLLRAASGSLGLADLVAPHNEHRLAPSRILTLWSAALNGRWDPVAQMVCNGALQAAVAASLVLLLGAGLTDRGPYSAATDTPPSDRRRGGLLLAFAGLVFLVLGPPLAPELLLMSMQTHFHAATLAGLWAVASVAGGATPGRSVVAAGLGLVAWLSLASGALVFLACAVVLAGRAATGVDPPRRVLPACLLFLACTAVTVALTPVVEHHAVFRADSPRVWLRAWLVLTSWPLRPAWSPGGWYPLLLLLGSVVVYGPLLRMIAGLVRRPPPADDPAWLAAGLAAWVALQAAALAAGRAIGTEASRYLQPALLGVVVSGWCVLRQFVPDGETAASTPWAAAPRRTRLIAAGWFVAVAAGLLWQLGTRAWPELHRTRAASAAHAAAVAVHLETGSFPAAPPGLEPPLPYPDAARLAARLDDPNVRRLLPRPWPERTGVEPVTGRLEPLRPWLVRAGPALTATGLLVLLFGAAGRARVSRRDDR